MSDPKMNDAISRSAVLDALEAEKARLMEQNEGSWPFTGKILTRAVDAAHEFVKDLPAIDATPVVHARWIPIKLYGRDHAIKCSACNNCDNPSKVPGRYCWQCGARMDGEENAAD